MTSNDSAATRHLSAAEIEARNVPGLSAEVRLRAIRKVGILGAGTMGGGIAMNFANVGIPTVVVEVAQDALDRGLGLVRRNYEASAAKGRMTSRDVEARMALLAGSLNYASLADCDLVIEAVPEDMELKQKVCAKLGAITRPGAIIATNTSTLDVDVLAEATCKPADVVGLHFFSPANVMRLLEIVRGEATAEDVLATVVDLAARIGKAPVVSGVCYGFIGNRMAEVYMRETEFLLMEGAEAAQIDAAVQELGMAMGPCRMLDMAGIDVGARTVIGWKKSGLAPQDPSYRAIVNELYRIGRHGQKTGKGYYQYEGRTPIPDPDFTVIAREVAVQHGITRRSGITNEELVERMHYPLANGGCRILEEGISYRPGDIDVVWVAGYGFPAKQGGPMYWAEEVGLSRILDCMRHYGRVRRNVHGYWTPSEILVRAASQGQSLAQTLSGGPF
jgi:3-hydroxyacyl-CoA dehydrogenase